MFDLSLFVSGTALLDSVSTTQQIIFLILLFSTEKPIRTSLGFILGVTVAYFICGLVGLAFVDKLNDMIKMFMPNLDSYSDASYYQAQVLVGVGLTVAGPLYWRHKVKSKKPPMENRLFTMVKNMNFWVALGLGAFLSATSFPGALPYVAAIEKIHSANLGIHTQWAFILLYNVMYAVPLLVPFVLFVILKDAILPKLHLHVQRLNLIVMIAMLSGMGLFLLADSVAFFVWAKPLMQTRFI
jgi:cytochrome c biogenesis protein CcdA